MELNAIAIGPYKVDLFVTEVGNLGVTVERADGAPTKVAVLDVLIPARLDPTEIHAG